MANFLSPTSSGVKSYLFDGMKAVAIDELPPGAWTFYSGGQDKKPLQLLKEYWRAVPWLFRGVQIRAQALSALPFAIVGRGGEDVDTSADYSNVVGFLPDPVSLFYLVEAALCLLGRAYLFREKNRVRTLGLRYLLPTSITPKLDEKRGLVGFNRQLKSGSKLLEVDDLVYFWQPDPFVEIGPPTSSPGQAACNAAGVLFNTDNFASLFFFRGAVKATLLTVEGSPPESEKKKLKAWWTRFISGIANAFTAEIISADVKPVIVGEGIGELSDTELTKEKREDIATALGVPQTMLWSTAAAGLGGGSVVTSDNLSFYRDTIVPEAEFVTSTLNSQLFMPLGYRLEFRPETLDVYQADENERAAAYSSYVHAGMAPSVTAQILGVELPAGMEYSELDTGSPITPAITPQAQLFSKAISDDLRKWESIARKRFRDNGSANYDFVSQYIPADVSESVKAALAQATTEQEVKAAFEAGFRPGSVPSPQRPEPLPGLRGWQGYP